MRDRIFWKPTRDMLCRDGLRRTVYVKHYAVPFCGLMAAADTAFSIPAYIRVKGRRCAGYVTPSDSMAFTQAHGESEFRPFDRTKHLLGL